VAVDPGLTQVLLTTEDDDVAPTREPIEFDAAASTVTFRRPGGVLLGN
jgi:hypothetical protein